MIPSTLQAKLWKAGGWRPPARKINRGDRFGPMTPSPSRGLTDPDNLSSTFLIRWYNLEANQALIVPTRQRLVSNGIER